MATEDSVPQCALWEYTLYGETAFLQSDDAYNTFGLCLHNGITGQCICCIGDISTDCNAVIKMAHILNKMQVEPVHFEAVVYDFVSNMETLDQF